MKQHLQKCHYVNYTKHNHDYYTIMDRVLINKLESNADFTIKNNYLLNQSKIMTLNCQ